MKKLLFAATLMLAPHLTLAAPMTPENYCVSIGTACEVLNVDPLPTTTGAYFVKYCKGGHFKTFKATTSSTGGRGGGMGTGLSAAYVIEKGIDGSMYVLHNSNASFKNLLCSLLP